ncbi:CAP domain-containing protein [Streptomyces sp. NPDC059063]|uniref:CAP domain-containing protein n=1 Tax=unclassified Streptomyces TaxID=2593676 RepID=UPI0036817303
MKKAHMFGALVLAAVGVTGVPATAQAADTTGELVGLAGKCLDVRGGKQTKGTPIQIHTCNSTASQKWTYTEKPGDIGSTLTAFGKCLDVASGGTADRTPVQLYDCNDSPAQKWVRYQGDTLVNPRSGKCLDVRDGNTGEDTPVQIHRCNATPSQVWKFRGQGGTRPPQSLQREVFDLINNYRAQRGKAPLQYDDAAARAAQAAADEQARRGQQGHWLDMFDNLRKNGYSRPMSTVAENAAGAPGMWKDARSVVDAWIKSPNHEGNLLGDKYKYTGVGLTIDGNGTYWWAQMFVG